MQSAVLAVVERAVSDFFGAPPARASVSFVGVEPIEVLRFDGGGSVPALASVTLVTLGMSRRPLGDAVDDPQAVGPRAELVVSVHGNGQELWRRLAVLAAAPVVEGVVYSEGMTVDLGEPLDVTSICTGGVLTVSEVPSVWTPAGEVAFLRFVPATSSELAYSRVKGSAVLRERWREAATDLRDLTRATVELA